MLASAPRLAPSSSRSVASYRPGLTERGLIVGLVFINAFGTPASWFLQNTGAASGPEQDFLLTYGSLAAIAVLSLTLVGAGDAVVRIVTAEPLMLLYFFVLGLSPIWSPQFNESLTEMVNFFTMVGLAIILLVRYPPREIFQLLAAAFTIGIIMDLFWVLAMGPLGQNAGGNWDGLATQKNGLGGHALSGVLIFLIAARTFRRFRVPFYLLTMVATVLLVGSQSKTSLGAGLVTMASFIVFLVFRARKTLVGAVVVALVTGVIISLLLVTANLETVAGAFGKDATFTGRTALWAEVRLAIEAKPWFGYGFKGFFGGPLSESHRISAYPEFDWGPNHAHNALLESALHVGIPLTIVYVIFNLRALGRATNHVRWVRGPIGLFPLVYMTMVTIGSFTESGFFTGRDDVTLFVLAAVMAKTGVDEAKSSGAIRLDEQRQIERALGTDTASVVLPAGPAASSTEPPMTFS